MKIREIGEEIAVIAVLMGIAVVSGLAIAEYKGVNPNKEKHVDSTVHMQECYENVYVLQNNNAFLVFAYNKENQTGEILKESLEKIDVKAEGESVVIESKNGKTHFILDRCNFSIEELDEEKLKNKENK